MKEGWKYVKLGDCCLKTKNIKWAETTSKHIYIDLSSVDRVTSKITDTIIVDAKNAPSRAKQIIEKGDVIFATTRPTLRRLAIIGNKFDNQICSTGFCVLRHNDKITDGWIYYQLKADRFYNYIEPLQKGANYPAVTDKVVKDYYIPLPPLSEQEEIVTYLDTSFTKIDAIKANAEKELEEAKKLFAAALKRSLSPTISHGEGEGWQEKTLGDLCYKITDGTHKTPTYFDSGYVFLSSKNVTTGKIDWNNVKYIDQNQHDLMYKRVSPQVGDILLAKNGTTGVAAMVDRDVVFDIYVSLALIRTKGEVISTYLLYYINSPMAKEQFNKRLIGMGVPNLHLGEIKQVIVTYPKNKEIQRSIVTYLDTLSEKVRQLQSNYEKISSECDALKQAILRETFE